MRRGGWAVGGVVAPVVFVTAWALLGLATPGYEPARDHISELAAVGAPTRAAMTAALVGYAVALLPFAARLPTPAGRLLAAGNAAATLGVAAVPLGPPAHAVWAGLAYATLAALPLTGAAPASRAVRAGWAVAIGLALVASAVAPLPGLWQRVGLTLGDAWLGYTAVRLLRAGPPAGTGR
jgi:hypothetical protein